MKIRMLFDVADECRSALLDILGPDAATWGSPDLAVWLAGPYRKPTRWARQSTVRRGPVGTSTPPPPSEGIVTEMLADARRTAVYWLARLSRGDGAFVRDAMAREIVVPRRDGNCGRIVPVDVLRMGLIDRILSLAAADCLVRPYDYTKRLTACMECCTIAFDQPCEHGAIGPPASGIRQARASAHPEGKLVPPRPHIPIRSVS